MTLFGSLCKRMFGWRRNTIDGPGAFGKWPYSCYPTRTKCRLMPLVLAQLFGASTGTQKMACGNEMVFFFVIPVQSPLRVLKVALIIIPLQPMLSFGIFGHGLPDETPEFGRVVEFHPVCQFVNDYVVNDIFRSE